MIGQGWSGGGERLCRGRVREATTAHCSGPDLVVGSHTAWGLGFLVDQDGFGIAGLGGSVGWASTQGNYALGFVTADMGTPAPAVAVENALRRCLGLADLD
jgi:hypothetical protein